MAERRNSEDRPDESGSEDRVDESGSEDRPDEDGSGERSDSERITGTAPSGADISKLEKFEASEEAKQAEPSKVDAMGQDKRRQVVGHSYGPSARRQIMFFAAVAVVLAVIIGGWLALVAAFDKPPTNISNNAPWSTTPTNPQYAAQQNATPVAPSSPCGEPGNQYPIPPQSPCAPASKANVNQGANSGSPSNVSGVSKGQ
jgi:hypothetical protein